MTIDETLFVRSRHYWQPTIFPNHKEYLCGPSRSDGKTAPPQGKAYLGHDDNALPCNVVFFKCFPKNALRFSVRVEIGRVEGIDAVVVPMSGGEKYKQRYEQQAETKDSRKLDVF